MIGRRAGDSGRSIVRRVHQGTRTLTSFGRTQHCHPFSLPRCSLRSRRSSRRRHGSRVKVCEWRSACQCRGISKLARQTPVRLTQRRLKQARHVCYLLHDAQNPRVSHVIKASRQVNCCRWCWKKLQVPQFCSRCGSVAKMLNSVCW